MRTPDIERLLQPASKILQRDGDFWKHQAGGLAIFLGTKFSRVYRLPVEFEPLVQVSSRFFIRPLLPLLSGSGRSKTVHFPNCAEMRMGYAKDRR